MFATSPLRRRNWTGAALALVALAGCEEAELPGAPNIDPQFSAVAIDRTTLNPGLDLVLAAGAARNYSVDVYYQREEREVDASPAVPLFVSWYPVDEFGNRLGIIASDTTNVAAALGDVAFTGAVTVPVTSGYCSTYDYVEILAAMTNGAAPDSVWLDHFYYEVTGTSTPAQPCIFGWNDVMGTADPGIFYEHAGYYGEPVELRGRNLTAATVFTVPGASGPLVVPTLGPVRTSTTPNGTTYQFLLGWIPAGAQTGNVSANVGGQNAISGGGAAARLEVAGTGEDWYEPNNTRATAANAWLGQYVDAYAGVALWAGWGLTIEGADLTPVDATYYEGDWFTLVTPNSGPIDVCVFLNFDEAADDLDLGVTNAAGTLLGSSASATADEFVRVNAVPAGTRLNLWVAPFSVTSAWGAYDFQAGDCTVFGLDADVAAQPVSSRNTLKIGRSL